MECGDPAPLFLAGTWPGLLSNFVSPAGQRRRVGAGKAAPGRRTPKGLAMNLPPKPLLVMIAEIQPAIEFKTWQAIQGGLDMLILRAKDADLEAIRGALSNLRTALGPGFPIVVNAGNRLPRFAQASGNHFPETSLQDQTIKSSLEKRTLGIGSPGSKLIGFSVHSPEAAKAAENLGADYVLAGTVFETDSHPGQQPGGLDHLRAICQATTLPVIAIGGITPENAKSCIQAGAYGVAALSPFKGGGREALAKAYKEAMR